MKTYIRFFKDLLQKKIAVEYTMTCLHRPRLLEIPLKTSYIRINTLELVAHEIIERNVPGAVAEVGVYKGDFACLLNQVFPDKKIYLFDTFEGFNKKDIGKEKQSGFSSGMQDFSDTSEEYVLQRMPHRQQAVVKKGWFPESLDGLEEQFAFVSLDPDLYQPIYSGLEYFYPRLSPGGYIFIHDYNNDEYKGARQAVRDYCSKYNVPFVPMSDPWGSAIIAK